MKYNGPKIGSVPTLAKVLSIKESSLNHIVENIRDHYRAFSITTKNGKVRQIYEPKFDLKKLQKKINSRILCKVSYPIYLQGGIQDKENPRDSFENAKIHINSNWVINLDIKNFYPNIKYNQVVCIFKYGFSLPHDVSNFLARLVTYPDQSGDIFVPQGAVTSSYIANLVFFGEEQKLVNNLATQQITYSRLIDDITLSSQHITLSESKQISLIKKVSMFVKTYNLSINRKKTKVTKKKFSNRQMEVTGLILKSNLPKCSNEVIQDTRVKVHICMKEYKANPSIKYHHTYHGLWNSLSGKVARLERSKHRAAKILRSDLDTCKPEYSEKQILDLKRKLKRLQNQYEKKKESIFDLNFIYNINYLKYQCSIVARTDITSANRIKEELNKIPVTNKNTIWNMD